jgi:hypothetical protein
MRAISARASGLAILYALLSKNRRTLAAVTACATLALLLRDGGISKAQQ